MCEWERYEVVKNWKFGIGNIVTIDKWRDTKLIFGLVIILEILIVSTKKIMNYSILTTTWNLKEKNQKLKSIWMAK